MLHLIGLCGSERSLDAARVQVGSSVNVPNYPCLPFSPLMASDSGTGFTWHLEQLVDQWRTSSSSVDEIQRVFGAVPEYHANAQFVRSCGELLLEKGEPLVACDVLRIGLALHGEDAVLNALFGQALLLVSASVFLAFNRLMHARGFHQGGSTKQACEHIAKLHGCGAHLDSVAASILLKCYLVRIVSKSVKCPTGLL